MYSVSSLCPPEADGQANQNLDDTSSKEKSEMFNSSSVLLLTVEGCF